ncbi:MAG TPA: hypothetical protein PKK14_05600 [Pseudomonadales bacterium]|nr:hypothetical protein [Pseudomonadales bacterium]
MRFANRFTSPLLTFVLCTLPLWVYGVLCGSTGHDDAHITFWQTHTLLEHGQLLNYNGERLEQSSSLLAILLTTLLALISPLSVITSGYLANLGGAVAAIALVYGIAHHARLAHPWVPALLTALTPYFAYWAWSGMDTSITAMTVIFFIFTASLFLTQSTPLNSIVLWISTLMLASTRPEMVVVGTVFFVITALLLRRPALLFFITAFIALMLWRYSYFGLWFPNPVYAKSGTPDIQQLQRGIDYFLRLFRHPLSFVGISITLLLLCASCVKHLQQRTKNILPFLCSLWALLYGGFVVTSGGDWMKEGRFWVPLIPPLWLAICTAFPTGKAAQLIRYGLPVLLIAYTPFFVGRYSLGTPLWQHAAQKKIAGDDASFFEMANREHLRDWLALRAAQQQIRQLDPSPEQPLVLMSKQMGMVNYHLFTEFGSRLRVWDMAGLVDNTLRDCTVMAQDGFDKQGLRINYRKFFERLPQAEHECGLRAPDIIYDIYGWGETTPLPDFLRTQGYTIVFNQTGRVNMKPGIDITAQETVAVKTALLKNKNTPTLAVNFNQALAQGLTTHP